MPRLTSSLITARVGKAERLLAEAAAVRRGEALSRFAGRAIRDAAISEFAGRQEARRDLSPTSNLEEVHNAEE